MNGDRTGVGSAPLASGFTSEKEARAIDWVDQQLRRVGSLSRSILDVGVDLMGVLVDGVFHFVQDPEMDDAAKERILARLFSEAPKKIELRKQVHLAYSLLGFAHGSFGSGPLPNPLTHSAVARFLAESLLPRLDETDLIEWRPYHNEAITRLLGYPQLPPREARRLCESVIADYWAGRAGREVTAQAALANPHCPASLLEQYAMSIPFPYLREVAAANPNCPEHARVAAALLKE